MLNTAVGSSVYLIEEKKKKGADINWTVTSATKCTGGSWDPFHHTCLKICASFTVVVTASYKMEPEDVKQ